ncbi:MAG: N-acetyltransferase family protein, partial [Acidimicrobiia bacterium]
LAVLQDTTQQQLAIARALPVGGDDQREFGLVEVGIGRQTPYSKKFIAATDRQRKGYGELLLRRVLEYGKSRSIRSVFGIILRENHRMLALAERLGFVRAPGRTGHGDIRVERLLNDM